MLCSFNANYYLSIYIMLALAKSTLQKCWLGAKGSLRVRMAFSSIPYVIFF